MLFLFIEIVLVAVMASKLGMEAADKGLSKILFMVLTGIIWIGSRLLGNFIAALMTYNRWIILIGGWTVALIAYMLFYYILSRMEDKYDFDTDKSWEERNKEAKAPNDSINNNK